MIRGRQIALAAAVTAAVTAGFSASAMADYVKLGSVDVGFHMDRDTNWSRFGGRMEGLRLVASRSDINCRSIAVTYGNGERERVFSGRLEERNPVSVDLAGGSRYVKKIDFVCRSDEFSGGKIYIMADVGRYRDEWRKSPDWSSYWSAILGGGGVSIGIGGGMGGGIFDMNNWVRVGSESFEGRNDVEHHYTGGWSGRSVDRIGLRAVNADATCDRVTVRFGNGNVNDLNADRVRRMDRGQFYNIDLPGNNRNIRDVTLDCHARGTYQVTIEIYVRK